MTQGPKVACGRILVFTAWAVVLGAGGVAGAQTLSTAPGPLEQHARPISAANPIPRRVHVVMPVRPSDVELDDARAVVTLRVTIDGFGSVAEIRSPCCGLIVKGRSLTGSDALIVAAAEAVWQWRYEPPVDSPLSFDVTMAFRSDGSSRLAADRAATGRLLEGASADQPSTAQVDQAPPAPWEDGALRVGGSVRPPVKIKHVAPTYPPEALAEGVSGVVVIKARIDTDGHIEHARVIRSVALLDDAALAAVRQWEFDIPLVNGVPTPILTDITIQFATPDPR